MLLIKNAVVNDPANGIENEKLSILIQNGKIKKVAKSIDAGKAKVIKADGLYAMPGLVDMHVHLREPGYENKETIASGSMAAAAGGFTSIACMANTNPVIDTAAQVKYVLSVAENDAVVNVFPYGAVTHELKGELITEMWDMIEAGAVTFSDDGHNISNAGTMMRALEYLKRFQKPIVVHAEDMNVVGKGTVNIGSFAERKGLHGIAKEAEEVIISRDILLAKLTGGKVHFTHLSTKGGMELVARAKKEGIAVSADVTPHHLSLSCEEVGDYNTNMKMKPPLRDKDDLKALKKGVINGTIDAIGTDHAPHTDFEKLLEFNIAPNGIIGLETAVPVILQHVIEYKENRMPLMAKVMSYNPAQILGIDKGTLSPGADADITLINADYEYVYSREMIVSKSNNSPYIGRRLKGRAVMSIVGGKVVYEFAE